MLILLGQAVSDLVVLVILISLGIVLPSVRYAVIVCPSADIPVQA